MSAINEIYDLILVGGGLANGLIALRLKQLKPDLKFLLIEAGPQLGGNHVWSFHQTDLSPESLAWIGPLVTRSWPRYSVHFSRVSRTLEGSYFSIRSRDFHHYLLRELGDSVLLNHSVKSCDGKRVVLHDRVLMAQCILDGTGFLSPSEKTGFQKFLGIHLKLRSPHGLKQPILMDARCDQSLGYHFMYVLPWSETEIFVEDTYYTNSPELDTERCTREIINYCQNQGWEIESRGETETGILPIPLYAENEPTFSNDLGKIVVGVRAGLFNVTTGYSLPLAVRSAEAIGNLSHLSPLTPHTISRALSEEHEAHFEQVDFFLFLNRMLFLAARPNRRYRIFRRFYRLSEDLIQRFYRGELNWVDRIRLLSGRPPVPVLKAVGCLWRIPRPVNFSSASSGEGSLYK